MPNYLTNDIELTSIADAIRAKTGGSSPIEYPNGFVSEIGNIPSGGGGGAVEEKQINFIDYDGTILHSYTKEEINAMSSESDLPSNPSHTGLTAQGWNWALAQIKAQLTAMPDAPVWVGQMYVTDDGKNRIYIHIIDKALCSMRLNFAVNGTVVVDWGDNTATETVTGTSLSTRLQTEVHTYASVGDYVITLDVTDGSMAFYSSSAYGLISHPTATTGSNQKAFSNMVLKIEIGSDTSFGSYAFKDCSSLGSVTIPSGITNLADHAFYGCNSLYSLTIPSSVTNIGTYTFSSCFSLRSAAVPSSATFVGSYIFSSCFSLHSVTIPSSSPFLGENVFYNCYALDSVTIPSGVTTLCNYVFVGCCSLGSLIIPSSVTTIGTQSLAQCYGMQELHFQRPSPPTVSNTNTFTNLPTYCKIYVPKGSLSSYTSYSRLPSSSTYTYIEE